MHRFSSPSGTDTNNKYMAPCSIYAILKEGDATLSVCAGDERRRHVYTSTSDSMEISIITNNGDKGALPNFVIQYEGIV